MSKAILSNKKVVNIIVSMLIVAINQYSCQNTEWLYGLTSDALYYPEYPSESQLLVLIEVQNIVDKNYIYYMQQYYSNIFNKYIIDPIALTFYFEESKHVCIKILLLKYYAKYYYIMTPTTTNNETSNTLEPMVVIQYVFSKQQRSIQGLKHQNNPTIQLLYSITQDALSNEIRTEDILVNVCEETKEQFKRIHDALENDDNPIMKMAQSYASARVVYEK
ncbi:hypothetical protein BDC45DRAFT_541047 [Circinella umbellata]|nr:hypothetical protein BDC45DRAFT_541047 [Circinella umbellata]